MHRGTGLLTRHGLALAVCAAAAVRNGAKRPDAFDWMGVLGAPDAEPARVAAGAELERLGWRKVSERGTVHRYEKGEWTLLASAMGAERLPSLPEGTGMLSFTATKPGSAGGGDGEAP